MSRSLPRALALLAALALAPASAQAAHQHELNFDKQEIFFEVPSGGAVTSTRAFCSPGYRVIQGSIRVDTVPGGLLTNVRVRTSAPDSGNEEAWFYELVNVTKAGNQKAAIKLMISCVKPVTTGGSGSQHSVDFAPRFDSSMDVAAARAFESQASLECSGNGPFTSPGDIPAGAGWVFDPEAGFRQLVGVQPTVAQASGGAGYYLGNSWDFTTGGNTSQVGYTLYANVKCLKHLTGAAFGESKNHRHYLDASVQIVSRQIDTTSGSSGYFYQSVFCPSGYYAVAPTWSIPGTANARGLRLVGIGYQGDQDVFRFVNPNGDTSHVSFGVICVGKKTSFSDSASPGAGPGPQKLLMSQRSSSVRVPAGSSLTRTLGCRGKTDIVTAGGISGAGADGVAVVASGGGPKETKWRFALRGGAADGTVKLWVKCLSPWAEGHTLIIDGIPSQAPDGVAKCDAGQIAIRPSTEGSLTANARYRCLERNTTQRIDHTHRLNTETVSRRLGSGVTTIACPAQHEAIAPRVSGGGPRLVRSYPDGRGWTFGFTGKGKATVTVTCLKAGTTPEVAQPLTQKVEER